MMFFLGMSLLAIFGSTHSPYISLLQTGILIDNVKENSSLFDSGIRANQVISFINDEKIENLKDYNSVMEQYHSLGDGETKKIIITTKDKSEFVLLARNTISEEISLSEIPKTRIQTGLDIRGGARALVAADRKLTDAELDDLISISQERLNVYGLSDLTIRKQSDSSGNKYMVVEIAGTSPENLEALIGQQGHFEAKIGNETVFVGGNKDVTHVGRTGQDAMVTECFAVQGGESCEFQFTIFLSEEAAQRHADITDTLSINGSYLSKKLDFFIDGKLTESLNIGSSLKGSTTTQISISGSGQGATREEAIESAKQEMKQLQTILITGSLPFKLEIVKIDRISPFLGEQFTKTIFIASFASFLAVCLIIILRYRRIKLSFIMLFVALSEIIMILGFSSLMKANLDLSSIAGIIAAIGTGINDQQVIVDETIRGKLESMGVRIKEALFIVFTSFATIIASLFPLFYVGAGLLRGFAVTSIVGVTIGVLITRPAFADMIKQMEK